VAEVRLSLIGLHVVNDMLTARLSTKC
jgi:hypothetical protein